MIKDPVDWNAVVLCGQEEGQLLCVVTLRAGVLVSLMLYVFVYQLQKVKRVFLRYQYSELFSISINHDALTIQKPDSPIF
jgi:hypothetical protein